MSIFKDILKACTFIIANAIIKKCDDGSNLSCTSSGGLSLGSNRPQYDGYYQQPQIGYNNYGYQQPQQQTHHFKCSQDCGNMTYEEVQEIRGIFMFSNSPQEVKQKLRDAGYRYKIYSKGRATPKIVIWRYGRSITIE